LAWTINHISDEIDEGTQDEITLRNENRAAQQYTPTIEDCYQFSTENGLVVEIIDTAALHRFPHLRFTYMQLGDAFLLVYSTTSAASLLALEPLHDELLALRKRLGLPVPAVLVVGTKADLMTTRQVGPMQCARIAADSRLPVPVLETSTIFGAGNVKEAFSTLISRHHDAQVTSLVNSAHPDRRHGRNSCCSRCCTIT